MPGLEEKLHLNSKAGKSISQFFLMEEQVKFNVNNFDLLRLFAATEVIADHYYQHLNLPISELALKLLYLFPGVPVFFIISGYLISGSFERNSSYRDYFTNRALRIFPGLWCCVIVTIVVFTITGVNFLNKETIAWLPSQLVGFIYTPSFLINYGFGSYNGSLWTIPVELQFYILLPILYFLFNRGQLTRWLFVLIALFTAIFLFSHAIENIRGFKKIFWHSFLPNFYLFLFGVLLQRLQVYKWKMIYNKGLYWLLACLSFFSIFYHYTETPVYAIFYNIILAFSLVSIAYTLPDMAKKLLRKNDISYGIYIYHGLILTVVVQLKLVSHINLLMVIAASYMLGYLSWKLIERPFIKLKRRPAV